MSARPIALLAATLLAAPAIAADYHRDALGSGGVNLRNVAVNQRDVALLGVALCDDALGALDPTFLCCQRGVGGAIIALDGRCGEKDLNPASKVSGGCTVSQTSAPLPQLAGDFSFFCGVDRDDDGLVTNVDAATLDPRFYDDDFEASGRASGRFGSDTIPVCFREDLAEAGDDFDDMAVFIMANVPATNVAVGTFSVDVNLAADLSCPPSGFADPIVLGLHLEGP